MAGIPCSSLDTPAICLSCGKDAIAHDRRILHQPDVSEVWTEFLMARLKNKSSLGFDNLSRLDRLVKYDV